MVHDDDIFFNFFSLNFIYPKHTKHLFDTLQTWMTSMKENIIFENRKKKTNGNIFLLCQQRESVEIVCRSETMQMKISLNFFSFKALHQSCFPVERIDFLDLAVQRVCFGVYFIRNCIPSKKFQFFLQLLLLSRSQSIL